jgi:hypothetical protein
MRNLREDFKDFKNAVENRFTAVENHFPRLNRLEVDVTEIKAICRGGSCRGTPRARRIVSNFSPVS